MIERVMSDFLQAAGFDGAKNEWRDRAACRTRIDVFLPPPDGRQSQQAVRDAKAVCADCPVINDCLDFALDSLDFRHVGRNLPYACGVWAGMTIRELDIYRTSQRAAA